MLALLSLLAATSASALALPTTTTTIPSFPETWTITDLSLHFMTSNDGLPGGGWPSDQPHFDSTLDFHMHVPFVSEDDSGDFTAICHASFKNGTLPGSSFVCGGTAPDEPIVFRMRPYGGAGAGGRPELAFELQIFSTRKRLTGSTAIWDDFSFAQQVPLFCSNGAPLDGMRCSLNGDRAIDVNATAY